GESILTIRSQVLDEVAACLVRETRGNADMMKRAGVIVQAQQQRSNGTLVAVLMPAKTGNDTIAIALVFDLEHDTLVGLVNACERLRDNTIESRTFESAKPVCCDAQFSGCGRDVNWRQCRCQDRSQLCEPLFKGQTSQVPVPLAQHIKKYNRRRNLLGEHFHTRCCWMEAKLQRIELECAVLCNYNFTVQDVTVG